MHNKQLELNILGIPKIIFNRDLLPVPRRQARALLYRLATELKPVARETLQLLFWPDSEELSARRNLTRLLSYLRSVLPDSHILQSTKGSVSLNPQRVASDCHDFILYTADPNEKNWEKANSLVRGPFLNGFSLPRNREFDNWLVTTQQQIERKHLAILSNLVSAKAAVGDYSAAISYGRQYLEIDDLAEDIHCQLITLYAAAGQRSAALKQYEQCMLVLERELGVQPLPETRAAFESVRDGLHPKMTPVSPQIEWTTLPGLNLPLIGRDVAWDKLEEAYAKHKKGGVIFISGEAGVGKSRLMQDYATSQDSLVLTGNSYADGQTLPYQPLMQALRQALSLNDRWQHVAPIWLAEASRLLPEIAGIFPGLPKAVDVDEDQAQTRLFEALTQLFLSLSKDGPVLLCLDDVHWADDASQGWLLYVTNQLAMSNFCILATYRSHKRTAIKEWHGRLMRAGLTAVVELPGLSEASIEQLLDQVIDSRQTPKRMASRIHAVTGGNTFFVLETIRELLETGQLDEPPRDLPLPGTVREAVLRRAGRLTPLAQQLLEITAVLSPSPTVDQILQVAGRDELKAAGNLEELINHHLLLSDGDRFHFQHILARDAIYSSIDSWRQRLLHRRAARTLASLTENKDAGSAAAIASHFAAAGDWQRAVKYYRQAAEASQVVYAHQETITYLKFAIQLIEEAQDSSSALQELYISLGDNQKVLGNFSQAEVAFSKALTLIPKDDALVVAKINRKLAETLPPQARGAEAISLLQTTLDLWDKEPKNIQERPWLVARLELSLVLLDVLYFEGKPREMHHLIESTQELLESVGTADQHSRYYARLSQLAFLQDRFLVTPKSFSLIEKALSFARISRNRYLFGRQQFGLGFMHLWKRELDKASSMINQALRVAVEIGDAWLHCQCLVYTTVLYRLRGDVMKVKEGLAELEKFSSQVAFSSYIGVAQANRAWLLFRNDDHQQAQARAEEALKSLKIAPYPFHWLACWILLASAYQQGQLADAVEAARAMLAPDQQQQQVAAPTLAATISAWESGKLAQTRNLLAEAITIACKNGYL